MWPNSRKLRVWSYLLKISWIENFIFGAVLCPDFDTNCWQKFIKEKHEEMFKLKSILTIFNIDTSCFSGVALFKEGVFRWKITSPDTFLGVDFVKGLSPNYPFNIKQI